MTTPTEAAELAREIDRLFIAVYRRVGPEHGERFRPLAQELGIDELAILLGAGDFLEAGTLTPELVRLRTRYYDPDGSVADIEAWEAAGLVTGSPWRATGRLVELLALVFDARTAVARSLWDGHEVLVADALAGAEQAIGELAENQSGSNPLGWAHAALPLRGEPVDALAQRLVTLRYLRMDDHASAWAAAGKTAAKMAAGPSDPAEWTAERQAIEAATNERSAATLSGLSDPAGFLELLRALPPHS